MISINRLDILNPNDCHLYKYVLNDNNKKITFYQSGNRDLNMILYSQDDNKTLCITKKDDYQLYKAFNNAYESIINLTFLKERSNEFIKVYKNEIYPSLVDEENNILWKSDAPVDTSGNNELEYNYLKISKNDETIFLTFIPVCDTKRSCLVEFNTDRSRYQSAVYVFVNLMYELEKVIELNGQITLDEYANDIKVKILNN